MADCSSAAAARTACCAISGTATTSAASSSPQASASRPRSRGAALADAQPFRLATLAFDRPRDLKTREAVLAAFARAGLSSAESGRALLGWTGGFDKLAMAKRVLGEIDDAAICCCGDPGSDAALFDAYPCAID